MPRLCVGMEALPCPRKAAGMAPRYHWRGERFRLYLILTPEPPQAEGAADEEPHRRALPNLATARGRCSSCQSSRSNLLAANRPNIVVILSDDMATPTSAATRRDRDAEPRRHSRPALAVHAVLQHAKMLPDAGEPAHGSLPASGGRRPHDGGQGHRRLPAATCAAIVPRSPRRSSRRATEHTPSAMGTSPASSVPTRPNTTGRCSAASTLLRHAAGWRQLFRPRLALPRQPANHSFRRPGVPCRRPITTPTLSATTPRASSRITQSPCGEAVLPLRCYTAAHWPMHALPKDVVKYKGKYDGGYEPIRKARLEKAAKLGVIDPHWGVSPWQGVGQGRQQAWETACMECTRR